MMASISRPGLAVSRDSEERLSILVEELVAWQQKTNLIAPSTLPEIWDRHVADSLQCVRLMPEARNWLDLGSGGGFPGLVVAAVMADNSNGTVTLVESNQKKCAFLRKVSRRMGARTVVICDRIENVGTQIDTPDVVTARALAALPKLLELSSPWLSAGAVGLFHKGRDFRSELADCDGLWEFDLIHHESKVASDSVILEIRNLSSART